ncbi:hypothetical protein GCM10011610_19510 [Nocardia rhizosphaerihabitans]|uniref:Uncharacterized protein n=1 Tax=Nocardia rhizosphaerihabitans TaxID=1691570 RepID=A0ABQ2K9L0_9NOCA|nr:hypothetical protein GCM10011610_19510 [Nocardia rhizosphaerihabitans]
MPGPAADDSVTFCASSNSAVTPIPDPIRPAVFTIPAAVPASFCPTAVTAGWVTPTNAAGSPMPSRSAPGSTSTT